MKHWTEKQYPLETLDKIPMEDKIILSREEEFFIPAEEIIAFVDDLYEELPETHRVGEVYDALIDAAIAMKNKIGV